MFDQLKNAFGQLAVLFNTLPTGKKIALVAFGVLLAAGILITSYLSSGEDYSVLYANLSQEDALAVTEKLKTRKIMFKLEGNGTAVSVPGKDVYQLRLELAGEGIPSGGGVGFELFDKTTFGMTEFVQKLNYRRALQGELQRTINSIATVQSSRVHISIPNKSLFEEDKQRPTASVVLKLRGNGKLNKSQVEGMAHLVSSSVEGLSPADVTIVDNRGTILTVPDEDGDEMTKLSNRQMEMRRNYESDIEKRIRTMLEHVVGNGKAIIRVTAAIDFKQEQRTEELYDPDSQVARSEHRIEEKSTGPSMPAGVAGVSSNIPETAEAGQIIGKPAESTKTQETVNYEINKVVKTVVEPAMQVKKLSVAVMVDGKYKETKGADNKVVREFEPLPDEAKERIAGLVRTAIGFEGNRQDMVTVESMQFEESAIMAEAERLDTESRQELMMTGIKYAGYALAGVILFIFLLRPIAKWLTTSNKEVEELRTFPQTVSQMEKELNDLMGTKDEEKIDYRKRVTDLISSNPDQAAELLRSWLKRAKPS